MRILWLYGPPGVGKSTTAWAALNLLADQGVATAYVDIDQLGMVVPAPDDDPHAELLAACVLAAVAPEYERRGAETLVVSGVLDLDLMPVYRELLEPFGLAMVRLTVDEAELQSRIEARGADDEEWAHIVEEAQAFEDAASAHPVVVAGAGATPPEVARRVIAAAVHTREAAPRQGQHDRVRPPDEGGDTEAILVGGTRAVGKSNVAWTAFMTARSEGSPTGFIDLRQIGFFGRDGGPVDHRFQAATLAAVWPHFRAAGAELLLLNGPVDEPEQAEAYRSALGGVPLTWHRLTADEPTLVDRVLLRGAGDGAPRLAGDTLVGLTRAEAREVAKQAYEVQRRADVLSASSALDTTHLTVREAALKILWASSLVGGTAERHGGCAQ
jgi:hypothetical protein